MEYDFNLADQQTDFDVIPAGTLVSVEMVIRPGGAGERGWLKQSRDGQSYMLDCEFVVLDGPHAKRKVWNNLTIEGTTEGHRKAAAISRSKLPAMIESGYGIKPEDKSATAMAMRKVTGFDFFHGLRFVAKLGVEPARDGYPARNTILDIITPDRPQWRQVPQALNNAQPVVPATPARPSWAA
jgi:hypothetical protein